MNKSQLLKSILKDRKPTFGTDPNDPWSAKANITEDAYLNKYLKSRGINPEFATKDQKVAHSKTGEFKKWKMDHLADVSMKSEAYVDKRDVVTFDIPFLIRVLEYSREDAKTDMDLHNVVTKLIQIRNKGVLTMKDYSFVTRLKEHFEITDVITEQEVKNPVKKEWEKYAQNRSEIWRKKRLKIDEISVGTMMKYSDAAEKDRARLNAKWDAKTASEREKEKVIGREKGERRAAVKIKQKTGKYPWQLNKEEVVVEGAPIVVMPRADRLKKPEPVKVRYQGDIIPPTQTPSTEKRGVKGRPGQRPMPKYEEVEQIDEISKGTLTSYAIKARADAEKLSKQGEAASKRSSSKSMQTALDKFRKATKRSMGAASAESKARVKEETEHIDEDLRKWFSKSHPEGGWKRINSKGEAIGPCAREPGEPKPKCMSNEKRAKLSKSERAAAVAAKRKHDPVADRSGKGGKPVNVSNFGKGKLGEEVEQLDEKNKPTNPSLWSKAKSMARSKFDVYPSAYANGWASKWYKSKGGGWKSVKEDKFQDSYAATQTVGSEVDTDVLPTRKREMTKSARMIKSIYKKNRMKEELYDHEKEDKGGNYGEKPDAAIIMKGGKTMTGSSRDTIQIDPMMKPRPGKPDPSKR